MHFTFYNLLHWKRKFDRRNRVKNRRLKIKNCAGKVDKNTTGLWSLVVKVACCQLKIVSLMPFAGMTLKKIGMLTGVLL